MPNTVIAPQDVLQQLQRLHDDGVINLDAPARQLMPIVRAQALKLRAAIKEQRDAPSTTNAAIGGVSQLKFGGYIFVGSDSWCDHSHIEGGI